MAKFDETTEAPEVEAVETPAAPARSGKCDCPKGYCQTCGATK